ncbi:AraC family transcriptional regulator [Undibacterium terreum]|uniref:Transcriptional regulator n=1 Tax=Undibacterium terreum TaxID=1224302 RepID=A0A916UCP7_9BURK|nr:AraC family transcriptional regulator [Undibacterium terreum]GGC67680.1 transcriptional regulator [Undibacterium terreum]
MDTLSHLLALYPLRTALDVRCHFKAPWILDHDGVLLGIAPYHLIVSGTAWLDAAREKGIALQPGDIIVFPKGDAHRLHMDAEAGGAPWHEPDKSQSVTYISNTGQGPTTDILCGEFRFDAEASAVLLNALPDVMLVRTAQRPDFAGLQTLMTMLRVETEAMRPGATAVVSQLSSALFTLVIRAWMEQAQSASGLLAVLAEERLQGLLQEILAAPEKPWELKDMAAACHMSRATFARVFNKVAGITPATLLLQIRMAQAAQWLAQGRRSVGEVGEAVGYQSEAAFNRVFKRSFGVGPGQYRRDSRLAEQSAT